MQFDATPSPCNSFDITYDATAVHPEAGAFPLYNFGNFFMNTFKCLSCEVTPGDDPYLDYYYDQNTALCQNRN